MKTNVFYLASFMFGLLLLLASCSDQVNQADEPEASAEEVELLLSIVGSALSDEHEGLLSGIMDLTAQPGENGLNYLFRHQGSERGGQHNFVRRYDPETGVHSIRFRRGVDRPQFRSLLRVQLEYIFQDETGAFIARPAQDPNLIETITFSGVRDGFTEGPARRSEFERSANWLLEGFGPANEAMQLSGVQENKGRMALKNRDGGVQASRSYQMLFNLTDISIQKPDASEDRLPFLVTGEIEYEIRIRTMRNGEQETREFAGTIELDGSGQALMRVLGIDRAFRLYLQTGEAAARD